MAPDYENDHSRSPLQPPSSMSATGGYQSDRDQSPRNQGQQWRDGADHNNHLTAAVPETRPSGLQEQERDHSREIDRGREYNLEPRRSGERKRSHQGNSRSASGHGRICNKCGEPLSGQFVRALEGTFHLDCFRCQDCGQIVASKFFPASDEEGGPQYPLCENDYFRRLGLLCYQCGNALRGSYITALDRKYHVDHFTCSLCQTVFGASDSYYEHDDQVYCHYHYSTQFAQRCNGCQTAILKQFVEIFRNGQNQHWHPECYMIHKFWNVRLTAPQDAKPLELSETTDDASRARVREEEERMEEKVYRIWSVLSTFEESSAACISDMLLHVSNGAYVEGVLTAMRFISHVEILFRSADNLDAATARLEMKPLSYAREAKLLCKKIVSFFSLLSRMSQYSSPANLGVTQELLSLVTSLAHYLKLLIRICLQGALRIEKEWKTADGLHQFLDDVSALETLKNEPEATIGQLTVSTARLAVNDSDYCTACRKPIENECAKSGEKRWHSECVVCATCHRQLGRNLQDARFNPSDGRIYCSMHAQSGSEKVAGFEQITRLQQYVFLLHVAFARLLDTLHTSGALARSADEAAAARDAASSGQGHGESLSGDDHRKEPSSYENTLNDVRRLRSTRLDKHLSSSVRKTRTSRVMDGPEGSSARPGSAGDGGLADSNRPHMQIVDDQVDESTADSMLGRQDALTLDDIPRIVAAEKAREQRPALFGRKDGIVSDSGYGPSADRSMDGRPYGGASGGKREANPQRMVGRTYFSELSGLEYFIVRHLAVLTILPMLEPEFTMEELLGFIESRKAATFWNKFGKAFKNDGKKNVKKKGVFGVPLEVIIERDGADSTDGVGPGTLRIPAIVDDIVSTMRKMDLSVEGVFRKNGNIKKLSELVERIDRDGCDSVNLSSENVVQIAALLKRYLRDLPDPLMTHKLYRLWLAAAKIPDEDRRRQCLHLTCCLLPQCHRDCLEILFFFLKWAGSFHQIDDESGSKMDIKNIATVIAPNILFVNSKAPALDSDPMFAIDAVNILINNIEEMCMVPDELADALNDPSLFNNNGEITTKEILKRFSERGVTSGGPGQQPYGKAGEVTNRHDPSTRLPARRVETDPAVWKNERSVRTVQDAALPSGGNAIPPYGSAPNQSTPSKWRTPDDTVQHVAPYPAAPTTPGQRGYDSADERPQQDPRDPRDPRDRTATSTPRQDWRNSGWGRGNGNGSVGVAGSG